MLCIVFILSIALAHLLAKLTSFVETLVISSLFATTMRSPPVIFIWRFGWVYARPFMLQGNMSPCILITALDCSIDRKTGNVLSDTAHAAAPCWFDAQIAQSVHTDQIAAAVSQSELGAASWQLFAHLRALRMWQVQYAQSHCRSAPLLPLLHTVFVILAPEQPPLHHQVQLSGKRCLPIIIPHCSCPVPHRPSCIIASN